MPDPPLSPHPLSYAQPDRRQSPAGIISFVCGLIAFLSLCLSLTSIKTIPGSSPAITPFIAILMFAGLVCVVLLGVVTGILGVLNPRRSRGLAIIGLVLNGLVSLFILLMIVIARLGPG
jgi:hypothetical protein